MQTSPKTVRKPQARSMPLRNAILQVAADYNRMSVRQLFYQLVARGAIEKTEPGYKRVCAVSAQMRLDGTLPYRKIVDGHRQRRVPWAFDDMSEALASTQALYRRNYWLSQPAHVEVWCEKDALSGVIYPVCDELGVPYVATRGFPSITLMYESAIELAERGKPAYIYYFGDHDASGRAISANLEGDLRSHGAPVEVRRIALEPAQIIDYDLPTRPGKKTDSRHKRFADEYGDHAVELDALPPDVLVQLVEACIRQHINPHLWHAAERTEHLERETLASIARLPLEAGRRYAFTDSATEREPR